MVAFCFYRGVNDQVIAVFDTPAPNLVEHSIRYCRVDDVTCYCALYPVPGYDSRYNGFGAVGATYLSHHAVRISFAEAKQASPQLVEIIERYWDNIEAVQRGNLARGVTS